MSIRQLVFAATVGYNLDVSVGEQDQKSGKFQACQGSHITERFPATRTQ